MRLWSFHPKYLDPKSLLAVWDDGLEAVRALANGVPGHPQLIRFQRQRHPLQAISDYLYPIADVACRFPELISIEYNAIPCQRGNTNINVTAGQLELEVWLFGSLLVKGRGGGPHYIKFWSISEHEIHPVFSLVRGAVEDWEQLYHNDYTKCACGNPVELTSCGKPRKYCQTCRPSVKRSQP